MGWSAQYEGSKGKLIYVYSTSGKHRHEAAMITKIKAALDKKFPAEKPFDQRSYKPTETIALKAKDSLDVADLLK